MKKIIKILFLLLLSISLNASGVIKVGMEAGYAPFNWFQKDDKNGAIKIEGGYVGGYDVEIAKLIAKKLNKDLVIVQSDWDSLLGPALNSNKVDLVIAGMSPTDERKKNIDFTSSYYSSNLVIVTRKDSKFVNAKSINEFKGAKLTGQLNTFHYEVIDQIDGVIKETASDNFNTMLVSLISGKIDGYISERPGAISASLSNSNITFVEFDENSGFSYKKNEVDVAIGLKKGNEELKNEVEKALSEIDIETRENLMEAAIKNQPNNIENEESKEINGFFSWMIYLLNNYWKQFLIGTLKTLNISLIGTVVGFFIGLLIAILKDIFDKKSFLNKLTHSLIEIYVTIIRGTPMIVQSIIFYYGISQITGINIPIMTSALIIVSYNTGAYITEIIRGGVESIDKGQYEAAEALGMNHFQIMRYVILPQAIKNTLPSVANEFIINIKDTSVLFSIGVTELYTTSRFIAGTHSKYYEVFIITSIIYFFLTFTLTKLFKYLEIKLDGKRDYKEV